ncbi:hypothetical protein D3C72_1663760 [compost metagenome]
MGGWKVWPHRCSTMLKAVMVSNIGTSTACPWPLRSRWNSAVTMAYAAYSAVVLSATSAGM